VTNDIRGAEQPGVFLRVASLASDLTCLVDMFEQSRLALKALGSCACTVRGVEHGHSALQSAESSINFHCVKSLSSQGSEIASGEYEWISRQQTE
jgi:hypothetical protein